MTTLLRIDTSPRVEGSQSRLIADQFVASWKAANPDGQVIRRDLAKNPVPHADVMATAAFLTGPDERTPELDAAAALSDGLVAEFQSADEVLIASPMYNFGVPSGLKAYVDHIVRAGMTFSFDPDAGFGPMAKPSRAYLAIAYGGAGYVDGPLSGMDFLKPYLESILSFIGVPKVETVYIDGAAFDPAAAEIARAAVPARIAEILAS